MAQTQAQKRYGAKRTERARAARTAASTPVQATETSYRDETEALTYSFA